MKFKSIVRSISPFSGKRNTSTKGSDDNGGSRDGEKRTEEFIWDLSNVDVTGALRLFYHQFNREKVGSVEEILRNYEGEEVLMLQQLCERYNIDEQHMQRFLDSNQLSSSKRPIVEEKIDYSTFFWDCEGIDVSKAVKLVYQRFNPDKTPKLSKLEEKGHEDIVILLQHLCQKYSIPHDQMQSFLDLSKRGRKTPSRRASSNRQEPKSTASEYSDLTASQISGQHPIIEPETAASPTRVPFQQQTTPAAASGEESDSVTAARRARISQQQRPRLEGGRRFTLGPVLQEYSNKVHVHEKADSSEVIDATQTREEPKAIDSAIPPNPVPSAGDGNRRGSLAPPPPPPPPVTTATAGGHRRASTGTLRPPPPPAPRVHHSDVAAVPQQLPTAPTAVTSAESEETIKLKRELEFTRNQMQQISLESQEMLRVLKESTSMALKATASSEQRESQQAQSSSAANEKEVLKLRVEAETLRAQLTQFEVEQRSAAHRERSQVEKNEQLQKAASNLEQQVEHLKDQQKKYKRKLSSTLVQVKALKKELQQSSRSNKEAHADRADLLELIEIMHSSPVSIAAVLNSFLTRLGDTAGVKEGTMPVADRISKALRRKRKQQMQNQHSDEELTHSTLGGAVTEEKSSVDCSNKESDSLQFSGSEREDSDFAYSPYPRNSLDSGQNRSENSRADKRNDGDTLDDAMMNDKYELARKYLHARNLQSKISNDAANQNLVHQQMNTSKAIEDSLESNQRMLVETGASDWIACFDPRSQRKYYYSASLKKSTWVKPTGLDGFAAVGARGPSHNNSRSSSPQTTASRFAARMTAEELQLDRSRGRDGRPFSTRSEYSSIASVPRGASSVNSSRSNSPAPSMVSIRSNSPFDSRISQHSGAAAVRGRSRKPVVDDRPAWVTAIDPKTQRRYWYNRDTKVSTWRKPAELII